MVTLGLSSDVRAAGNYAIPPNRKADMGHGAGTWGGGDGGTSTLLLATAHILLVTPRKSLSARGAVELHSTAGLLDFRGRCRLNWMRMHAERAHRLPGVDTFLNGVEAFIPTARVATQAGICSGPLFVLSASQPSSPQRSTHQVSKIPTVRPCHTKWYRYPWVAGGRLASPRKGGRHQYLGSRVPRWSITISDALRLVRSGRDDMRGEMM
jgi:hypothetical protein